MTENKGVLLMFYKASYGTLWDKLIAKLDGSPHSHVEIVQGWQDYKYLPVYLGTVDSIQTIGCRADTGKVSVSTYHSDSSLKFRYADFVLLPEASETTKYYKNIRYGFLKLPRTKFTWWKLFFRNTDVCSTWVARVLGLKDPDSVGVKDMYDHAIANGYKVNPLYGYYVPNDLITQQ